MAEPIIDFDNISDEDLQRGSESPGCVDNIQSANEAQQSLAEATDVAAQEALQTNIETSSRNALGELASSAKPGVSASGISGGIEVGETVANKVAAENNAGSVAATEIANEGREPTTEDSDNANDQIQRTAQALQDQINATTDPTDRTNIENASKLMDRMVQSLKDFFEKTKDSPDKSAAGTTFYDTFKKLLVWLASLAATGAAIFGAGYAILKMIGDAMSGCYQYKKDASVKIVCLDKNFYATENTQYCRCLSSSDGSNCTTPADCSAQFTVLMTPSSTSDQISTACTDIGSNISAVPPNPVCTLSTGTCSDATALVCDTSQGIYYAFKQYTPSSLVGDAISNFPNLFKLPGALLKKVLFIILYVVLALFGIVIIYYLGRWVVSKVMQPRTKKKSQSMKK